MKPTALRAGCIGARFRFEKLDEMRGWFRHSRGGLCQPLAAISRFER